MTIDVDKYETLVFKNNAMSEFLEAIGFSQSDISEIANGCRKFKNSKKSLKAIVVLELEVDKDISKKYPNFIFNYNSPNEFLMHELSSYNAKLPLSDVECLKEIHFSLDLDGKADENFEIDDVGYRTKLLKYNIL